MLIHFLSTAASYDHTIILWDIGVPDLDYRFQARYVLCRLEQKQFLHLTYLHLIIIAISGNIIYYFGEYVSHFHVMGMQVMEVSPYRIHNSLPKIVSIWNKNTHRINKSQFFFQLGFLNICTDDAASHYGKLWYGHFLGM